MRRILDFVNVAVGVLAGAYLVLLATFGSEGLLAAPGWFSSLGSGTICFLTGAALVGANVQVLAREWKIGGLRRNLRISTDQGMTELSVTALEMLLLRDLRAEPDIVDPQVLLTPCGEGRPMTCEVGLKLLRQTDVIKRMDSIKRLVRDDMDRLIPGGLTVDVKVEVRDFINDSSVSDRLGAKGKEFTGPVYSDVGSDGV
ncbi:MAG: hypothetical protein LBU64_04005 [Planctomycetota bacterium]|jgi:hypothetical protein|nr:hypothetical protein [Planctomycetota bacterium]